MSRRLRAKPEAVAARGLPVVRCDPAPVNYEREAAIERHGRAVRAHERLCEALTAVDAAYRELAAALGTSHAAVRAALDVARPLAKAKQISSQVVDVTRNALK